MLLGHPVQHSLSPVFQNAALRHVGRDDAYEAIDVTPEALDETLTMLGVEHAGGNVTVPYKEAVAAHAHCSLLAQRIGAVNTFWYEDGALIGHNTDVAGTISALQQLCPDGIAGATCAVLGAGGSAASILIALESLHVGPIRMATRSSSRAIALSLRVGVPVQMCGTPSEAAHGAELVINATPIGLRDEELPVHPSDLAPHASVLDLVYRRGETAWVRACRAAGLNAADGLHMLLEQGAVSFECWFNTPAPRELMWDAVRRALA